MQCVNGSMLSLRPHFNEDYSTHMKAEKRIARVMTFMEVMRLKAMMAFKMEKNIKRN